MSPLLVRTPHALPPHLSGAAVSATVDSELAGTEMPRVLTHLSRCAVCRQRVEDERVMKDRLRALTVGAMRTPGALHGSLLALGYPDGHPATDRCPAAGGLAAHVAAAPESRPVLRGGRVTAGVFAAVGLGLGVTAAAIVPTGGLTSQASGTGSSPERMSAQRVSAAPLGVDPAGAPRPALTTDPADGVWALGMRMTGVPADRGAFPLVRDARGYAPRMPAERPGAAGGPAVPDRGSPVPPAGVLPPMSRAVLPLFGQVSLTPGDRHTG